MKEELKPEDLYRDISEKSVDLLSEYPLKQVIIITLDKKDKLRSFSERSPILEDVRITRNEFDKERVATDIGIYQRLIELLEEKNYRVDIGEKAHESK